MTNHYFDRREEEISDVVPVMALMSFREFTKPTMADNRPPAVELTLHAADLELARDINLYTGYLETVWVNHPHYLKEFQRQVDQMRFHDIKEFDFAPVCGNLDYDFQSWQEHWRPSQPHPRTENLVSYPRRGEIDPYLITIRGYLHYLCGEVRDNFTETVKDIRAFLKVGEIWVANNPRQLNGEERGECPDTYHRLDENAPDYPQIPRVLAKVLHKMEEFKQLEKEKARLIAEDKARIAKLWEDDGDEWDEIEALEAELEILEELDDEDSNNASIIFTPDYSDTDERMAAVKVPLPDSTISDENGLGSSHVLSTSQLDVQLTR
jgi:hypothetical protein